jgi:hypothetical protein
MRNSRTFCGLAATCLLGVMSNACGSATPAPAKPTAKPVAAAPAPAKPPKERLLVLLRATPRPAPVLELLPTAAQSALDARLKSLAPEQREQVLRGELAQAVPLLHLKAGGGAASALLALATTPAAIQELPLAFESTPQSTDDDRRRSVQLAHDLAQRAAQHFLRDSVLDVANAPAEEQAALLSAIARAAVAAERPDIARLALETLAVTDKSPDLLLRLAAASKVGRSSRSGATRTRAALWRPSKPRPRPICASPPRWP